MSVPSPASGKDAGNNATITPANPANAAIADSPSFARQTATSVARSQNSYQTAPSQNSHATTFLPSVPGGFDDDSSQFVPEDHGHITDSDDEGVTQIRNRGDSIEPLRKGVSFESPTINVTKSRGGASDVRYHSLSKPLEHVRSGSAYYPTVEAADDASNMDLLMNSWTSPRPKTPPVGGDPAVMPQLSVQPAGQARKVTGYVAPKADAQEGRPILSAYEYNADGEPVLVGELDKTLFEDAAPGSEEQITRLYALCFDTVFSLQEDLQRAQDKYDDTAETLVDERERTSQLHNQVKALQKTLDGVRNQLVESDGQVINLTEQLRLMKDDAGTTIRDTEGRAIAAERRADRLTQRKDQYKAAYEEEYKKHEKARKEIARLARVAARRSDDPDDSGSDSDGPVGVPRRSHRGANLPNPRTPLATPSAITTRRSKQPEPAVFEGPTGTKPGTYQKWKLDMMSWFRAHPLTFEDNDAEQLDYIRMKTSGTAWEIISDGWFIEGDEYTSPDQAWSVLDTCYGSLNTRMDAHTFYDKEGHMKSGESISSYLARFKAGVAPLKWADEEKILQIYKKLPQTWRSRIEYLMDDDRYTKNFQAFSEKLRRLEQLNSALNPANPNRAGGGSGGGGGGGNRNRNTNTTAVPATSGEPRSIVTTPYGDRTLMETQVLRDMNRCYKCTRKGHKPNSDDAPCKSLEKPTSMGRYPEVLAALNEARRIAGVPIPKASVKVNAVQLPTPEPSSPGSENA